MTSLSSPQTLLLALTQQRSGLPAWAYQTSQSVTYARAYLDAAIEQGVDAGELLHLAQLSPAQTDDPAAKLALIDIWRLCAAAAQLTQDACLGFAAGYRMPLTAHGSLGYALMCSASLRDAIGILERYWHLRGRGISLSVHESSDAILLELLPEVSMASPLLDMMFHSILTSMYRSITFLIPQLPTPIELWLKHAPPAGIAAWQQRLPGLRFNMPYAGLSLQGDMSLLDQALPNANPEALAQALTQCERELALLAPTDATSQQVRTLLRLEQQGYPTASQLAAQLHLTPRTLRRRLQEQGVSYQHLLEQARRRDSCRLLSDPALSISHIGELLGYTDPANFTRAFKSWYGLTPSDWRQQRLNDG